MLDASGQIDPSMLPPIPSGGVTELNGLTGDVVLAAGTGIAVATMGQTITVTNTGGGRPAGGYFDLDDGTFLNGSPEFTFDDGGF